MYHHKFKMLDDKKKRLLTRVILTTLDFRGINLEAKYLDLMQQILHYGHDSDNRTGIRTRSILGAQLRYNLQHGFPVLTTKEINFLLPVKEMLWFLSGCTNIKPLQEQRVYIWNEWADDDGDLGPVYGKQWRDFNGVDQVADLVSSLKNKPNSRRHIISGWNPSVLPDESIPPHENVKYGKAALPPCHILYQFDLVGDKLTGQLYIRSNDMFLGNPFNTIGLAALTHMLAQQCDYDVGEIILHIANAHIYHNHFEQVDLQLLRKPFEFPKLEIRKAKDIFSYKPSDFYLHGYKCHSKIRAKVAV